MPSTESPKCILVKIGKAVSEKKMCKDYEILYMYSLGGSADNQGGQTFDCN